jgi:hypothetical protein
VVAPALQLGVVLVELALEPLDEGGRDLVFVLGAQLATRLDRMPQLVTGHEVAHGLIVRTAF